MASKIVKEISRFFSSKLKTVPVSEMSTIIDIKLPTSHSLEISLSHAGRASNVAAPFSEPAYFRSASAEMISPLIHDHY
jgi:hypothetical protein